MTHDHSHHQASGGINGNYWTSRAFMVFLGFAVMALVLLWSEHRAHILGILPYLFILACPLMHIFMHRGHGHHAPIDKQSNGRAGTAPDGGAS